MKKILATVSAVALSLAMVAMPSVALADDVESTEPVTTETVTTETETTETVAPEPETTETDTPEPEATETVTPEPETTEPETAAPVTTASQPRPVVSNKPADPAPPAELLCTDLTEGLGYEEKVDIDAEGTATVWIPSGFTLVAYCVKSGTEPIIIDSDDDAPGDGDLPFTGPGEFIIDHPTKPGVSHYQLLLVSTQPTTVTPDADFVDESCDVESKVLTQGVITVDLSVVGVTYLITQDGNPVAFDAETGETGPLTANLTYIVTATASPGYVLFDPLYSEEFTPLSAALDCDTLALVTPQASQDPGCELPSFFIIGNSDSNSEALSWTANGEPIAEGKHFVNGPTTVHLVATGNGPEHGIEEGAQNEWTFTFPIDESCGELNTLALTGSSDTTPALALTAFLGLLGLAMVRSGIRVNRIRQEA
jgi:hypothetical protein